MYVHLEGPSPSDFTETEAAKKAAMRLQHVVDRVVALEKIQVPWPLPAGVSETAVRAVSAKIEDLRGRIQAWAKQIDHALWVETVKALDPLYVVGVGLQRIFAELSGRSPATFAGSHGLEMLAKIRAFEVEVADLSKEVETALKVKIPGIVNLGTPTVGRPRGTIVDLLWSLVKIGGVAAGVWYVGIPVAEALTSRIAKDQRPEYLKDRIKDEA